VGVKNLKGAVIGRGRVNYASEEVAKILGRRTDEIAQVLGARVKDEVIHHNNWVAFRPGKAS
jgi:glutamate 5-kinase